MFDCELLMSAGEGYDDGITVQGEHDGLEEGRSDPEGRDGPARPSVAPDGEEEHGQRLRAV